MLKKIYLAQTLDESLYIRHLSIKFDKSWTVRTWLRYLFRISLHYFRKCFFPQGPYVLQDKFCFFVIKSFLDFYLLVLFYTSEVNEKVLMLRYWLVIYFSWKHRLVFEENLSWYLQDFWNWLHFSTCQKVLDCIFAKMMGWWTNKQTKKKTKMKQALCQRSTCSSEALSCRSPIWQIKTVTISSFDWSWKCNTVFANSLSQ